MGNVSRIIVGSGEIDMLVMFTADANQLYVGQTVYVRLRQYTTGRWEVRQARVDGLVRCGDRVRVRLLHENSRRASFRSNREVFAVKKNAEGVVRVIESKRLCLRCNKQFASTGPGNRICSECREINEGRSVRESKCLPSRIEIREFS